MTKEEAIKEIMSWDFLNETELECLQTLIPELRETKEERIVNSIIRYLNDAVKYIPVHIDEWVAYLEKQKEQNPAWSEEDEKIAKEIEEELWCPEDFPDYPSKEESELYDDYQRKIDWFNNKLKSLRHVKQEWSKEDVKRIQRICDFLWKNRKGDTDTIYQIEKDVDWLKSLPLLKKKNEDENRQGFQRK